MANLAADLASGTVATAATTRGRASASSTAGRTATIAT
jgi:hypothetical protein